MGNNVMQANILFFWCDMSVDHKIHGSYQLSKYIVILSGYFDVGFHTLVTFDVM